MEALGKVSKLLRLRGRRRRKQKQLVKVEMKVRMDCDGCERKVKKSVKGMKGVTSIEVDRRQHRLTVEGYVEPNEVVERVRKKSGKAAELWPYPPPYMLLAQGRADGAYDKKAPAVHAADAVGAESLNPAETVFMERHLSDDAGNLDPAKTGNMEEDLTDVFSDENPNACILM